MRSFKTWPHARNRGAESTYNRTSWWARLLRDASGASDPMAFTPQLVTTGGVGATAIVAGVWGAGLGHSDVPDACQRDGERSAACVRALEYTELTGAPDLTGNPWENIRVVAADEDGPGAPLVKDPPSEHAGSGDAGSYEGYVVGVKLREDTPEHQQQVVDQVVGATKAVGIGLEGGDLTGNTLTLVLPSEGESENARTIKRDLVPGTRIRTLELGAGTRAVSFQYPMREKPVSDAGFTGFAADTLLMKDGELYRTLHRFDGEGGLNGGDGSVWLSEVFNVTQGVVLGPEDAGYSEIKALFRNRVTKTIPLAAGKEALVNKLLAEAGLDTTVSIDGNQLNANTRGARSISGTLGANATATRIEPWIGTSAVSLNYGDNKDSRDVLFWDGDTLAVVTGDATAVGSTSQLASAKGTAFRFMNRVEGDPGFEAYPYEGLSNRWVSIYRGPTVEAGTGSGPDPDATVATSAATTGTPAPPPPVLFSQENLDRWTRAVADAAASAGMPNVSAQFSADSEAGPGKARFYFAKGPDEPSQWIHMNLAGRDLSLPVTQAPTTETLVRETSRKIARVNLGSSAVLFVQEWANGTPKNTMLWYDRGRQARVLDVATGKYLTTRKAEEAIASHRQFLPKPAD